MCFPPLRVAPYTHSLSLAHTMYIHIHAHTHHIRIQQASGSTPIAESFTSPRCAARSPVTTSTTAMCRARPLITCRPKALRRRLGLKSTCKTERWRARGRDAYIDGSMDRGIDRYMPTCPSCNCAGRASHEHSLSVYFRGTCDLVQALLLLLDPTRALTFANVAHRNLQNIDYCVDKFKALSIRLQCIKSFNPGNFLP